MGNFRRLHILILLVTVAWLAAACSPAQSGSVAQAESGVYIENKGSDTIVNLALAWAEAYQAEHPEVGISVTGGGSGTGITSLISKTVDIANASRAMKDEEYTLAREAGIEPVEHVIARDAIAVIVNPENPIDELSLPQIAAIYKGEITNWQEVGGEDRPIVRLSRETNSGTHVYFLEAVVRLGDKNDTSLFAMETLLLPSSEGIISEVRDNPNAIGYDGLGYVVPEVKVLAVAKDAQSEPVLPAVETVNDGLYPISRDLYMYTSDQPGAAVTAYLAWIMSAEAQAIVQELGFVPVGQ